MVRIKIFILIGIMALFSCALIAGKVDETVAKKVALNWYRHFAPPSKKQAIISKSNSYRFNGRDCFHIFSFDKGGYVLVPTNDAVVPILGYGFDKIIPDSITNPAVKNWFDIYARQIDTAFVLNLQQDASGSKWDEILANQFAFATVEEAGPLLSTTWNQGWPYNRSCPADPNGPGGHTVTGCVATAMAQIMKYYNYPVNGFGTYGYFHYLYGLQSADFGATTYAWDKMPEILSDTSSEDQKNAVSTLMYHCGVIVEMNYGTDGSSAQIGSLPYSLFQNFNYSIPTLINHQMYPFDSLSTVFKTELDANRPIYYAAGSTYNGARHALVCDGYMGDEFFHFNFGWGGMADGYYYLQNVSPVLELTNNYEAIINIMPDNGTNVRTDTSWSGVINIDRRIGVRSNATLTIEPGTIMNFSKHGGVSIYGNIQATGTAAAPIVFTAQDTTNGWNGIELNNALQPPANQDSSKFIFCQITHSKAYYTSTTSICGVYYWVTPAIRITNASKLLIKNCTISDNIGRYRGGAIDFYKSSSRITDCLITQNKSDFGSAFLISTDLSSPLIENNIISNNSPVTANGHGSIVCETWAKPLIRNNEFRANSAGSDGSAFYSYYESSPVLVNNLFSNNFSVNPLSPYSIFGTIAGSYSTLSLANNTIVNNVGSGVLTFASSVTLTNDIIWGNSLASIHADHSGPNFIDLNFCDIQGGRNGIFVGDTNSTFITYENCISDNPAFADTNDFHLPDTSSCVNAGIPDLEGIPLFSLDISDNPRIYGGRIDMGAYENQVMIAEDYIYLNTNRADFISNHSVTDTAYIKITYINNEYIDSLSSIAPPFSCLFNNDSTVLRFEILSPDVGCFIDTLTLYASTGNFHIPISAWVGTVGKGAVSGIWDTTIVKVKGDIFIANGQTLQVFPGTKVEFLGHYKIDVQGRILALGDSAEPVIFTPAQHETGWKGIRFINTSPANDSSIVSYCTLEYALNHGPSELNGGAVYVTNFSKLRISNCLVRNNHAQSGGGIMIADGSNIDVRNCIIKNNGGDGGGLYISYNSNPMIIGNQIIGNEGNDGGGININYGSNPLISNNLIMNNLGAWGGGFRIWAMSDPLIYNNTIINNSAVDAGGFRIENSSHPKISNNIIYGNKVYYDNSVVIDSTQIYLGTSADPDFFNNNI